MSTSTQSRPQHTKYNSLIEYNDSLKQNERTSGYFGDSPEAVAKREAYLKKYYEAVFTGNTDSIDMFQLDAVKLNMTPEVAQRVYNEAIKSAQKTAKDNSKTFRIYNGTNIENTVLQDLRNYKNFRSSAENLTYNITERTKYDKSYYIFITIKIFYDV